MNFLTMSSPGSRLVQFFKITVVTFIACQILLAVNLSRRTDDGGFSKNSRERSALSESVQTVATRTTPGVGQTSEKIVETRAGVVPVRKGKFMRTKPTGRNPIRSKVGSKYNLKEQENYTEYFRKRERIVNAYTREIKWLENPACESPSDPYLLIIVTSRVTDRLVRERLRLSWGSVSFTGEWTRKRKLGRNVTVLYLVGRPENGTTARDLETESRDFADLIVADFVDVYKNLTLKTALALRWGSENCADATYIMKADSDIFLNVPRLLEDLPRLADQAIIMGLFNGANSLVIRGGQYGVPVGQYPFKIYPPYLAGNAYVMHIRTGALLYNAALYTPFINMEDVYFTGILATIEGARLMHNLRFANNIPHSGTKRDILCRIWYNMSIVTSFIDRWRQREIWDQLEFGGSNPC